MSIQIEKGIPIPDRARKSSYPFGQMEVGDSFLDRDAAKTISSRAYNAANIWGRNHGVKFAGRQVEGGVRIWRVE